MSEASAAPLGPTEQLSEQIKDLHRAGDHKVRQDLSMEYSAIHGVHCQLFASETLVFLLNDL
ncbi:MAG: hypothetical protein WCA32_05310 [Chromatiaceae bacterium]